MGTSSTTTCEPPVVMEKILRVTLDIIHLLTGRGDVVVKKSGDSIFIDPPPYAPTRNDKERILDLTHEMVKLLMGERSVDTSRDVLEDAAQEDPQAVRSSVDGPDVTSRFPGDIMREKKSPWNITVRLNTCNDGDVDRSAEHTQVRVKIEADDEDHFPNAYETEERLLLNIKEEPLSGDEAVVSAPVDSSQRTTCQIKEESFSSEGESATSNIKEEEILSDSNIDSSHVIKVKLDCSEEENPSDVDNMAAVHQDCSSCSPPNLVKTKPCPQCGGNFCCNSALARHQAAHAEEKAFTSSERSDRTSSNPTAAVRQKPLVCLECGQQFSFKSKLVRHQAKHTGEKRFSCPECGKSYGCNAAFLAHRRLHPGKASHSCPVCKKCFPQKNILQRHLSIHTGEKPHSCPECGKRFMSKSNLTQHLSVHLPKKKETFCCPECGKCYKRRADFRWHMLIHLGEK